MRSRRPVRLAVCLVAMMWMAGGGMACGEDDPPRAAGRGIASPQSDLSAPSATRGGPATSPEGAGPTGEGQGPATTPPGSDPAPGDLTPPAAEAAPTPTGIVRDFENELRVLVGDPSSCVADMEDPPESLDIVVTATTTSSGVITRVSAAAPNLDADQVRCLERRFENARFRAPVEAAPRTIVTTVTLRYRAAEANGPG